MALQFDLTDISLFVKIAETSSVTRGAQQSFMSAPAASVRIKNVEERLGTKLLHRTSHGVTLTPAGQAFMSHGRILLRQLDKLQEDMREYARGVKGHVQILAGSTAITEFLPGALCRFLEAHKDIAVEMRECPSAEIVRSVSDGTAEIGIIAEDVSTKGLEVLPYRGERLVIIASPTHALARRKTVSFDRTLAFDHVALSGASDVRVFVQQALQNRTRLSQAGPGQTGINPAAGNAAPGNPSTGSPVAGQEVWNVRIQVGDLESLCRIVETGTAIGILPESAARRHAQTMAIRVIELTDTWAAYNLKICVRELRSLPRFTLNLIDLLIADGAKHRALEDRRAARGKRPLARIGLDASTFFR